MFLVRGSRPQQEVQNYAPLGSTGKRLAPFGLKGVGGVGGGGGDCDRTLTTDQKRAPRARRTRPGKKATRLILNIGCRGKNG